MQKSSPPLVIIPAAGFGRRVGSPPAKELLLRPGKAQRLPQRLPQRLIDEPIWHSLNRGWPVLVITRSDKTALIDYLGANHPQVQIQVISETPDWQSTVLQSKELWHNRNLLYLPDVEFEPVGILDNLVQLLSEFDLAVGQHSVADSSVWGHVWATQTNCFSVIEKPEGTIAAGQCAWGLLAFKKFMGEPLLRAQLESQMTKKPILVKGSLGVVRLTSFRDLTR
jgi:hypothetical protein